MLLISWKCCGEVKYNIVCIACIKIKKKPLIFSGFLINRVELEGVEPSSKQGNHTLSTCLFWSSFSSCGKTQTTNHSLIL